mgnify:CR=1 FL=1
MSRHHETEIKLKVDNVRALRRRLTELGFRRGPRHLESNVLFDFPDLRMWKARSLLRLRLTGRRWILTFKGTPVESVRYKVRREIEAEIKDGERMRAILESLGLRAAFRYEKYRTAYVRAAKARHSGVPLVLYDETPIGNYVELEGPKRWIDETARQLGYGPGDYITASYAALYRRECQERGREPGDMLFASRKS